MLLDGVVRMGTLHSYSALANKSIRIYSSSEIGTDDAYGIEDGEHGVQIDECEGAIRFFGLDDLPPDLMELRRSASSEVRSKMQSAFYLEENTLPYLHLYCMYLLKYDMWTERPVDVDCRLRGFGDTVVLFIHPETFLMRLKFAIMQKCRGCCHIEDQPVEYLPETDRSLWNQFCKRDIFSWQHEYRVSAGGLDVPDFAMPETESPRQHMARDLEPWFLDVGKLHDHAIALPLEDIIRGELPDRVRALLTQRAFL